MTAGQFFFFLPRQKVGASFESPETSPNAQKLTSAVTSTLVREFLATAVVYDSYLFFFRLKSKTGGHSGRKPCVFD